MRVGGGKRDPTSQVFLRTLPTVSTNHLPQHAAHKDPLDTRVQRSTFKQRTPSPSSTETKTISTSLHYLAFCPLAMASISTGPSHSRSSSTITHRCAACCTLFSRPEPPQNRGSLKSSRPLPTPPHIAPPLPALSAPSLPTAPLPTSVTPKASPLPSCHSHSPRPLPKMPRSSPSQHGTIKRDTYTNERSLPPASPDVLAGAIPALQQPVNSKEIRHGDLSKPQHHPEKSAPSDLALPELDAGELSDSLSSDEKHYRDPPLAPTRPECVWDAASPILEKSKEDGSETLVRQYSRRCLREEKGRRWVEEDYRVVAQFLRKLR